MSGLRITIDGQEFGSMSGLRITIDGQEFGSWTKVQITGPLVRCADALERIADALETRRAPQPLAMFGPPPLSEVTADRNDVRIIGNDGREILGIPTRETIELAIGRKTVVAGLWHGLLKAYDRERDFCTISVDQHRP